MAPPFTAEQFFDVFVAYNTVVWPAQVLLVLVALAAVAVAVGGVRGHERLVPLSLGALWIWMGAAYHWAFFADINPAAPIFAVLFVAEGMLLLWVGLTRRVETFRPRLDGAGVSGGFLVLYALLLYPLLGVAAGHRYPANPTFGLPCPTTIFTVGLLLWARPRVPPIVLVVPALWAVVGASAVRFFGVLEDAMLPVAGPVGSGLILWRNRRSSDRARSA